MTLTQKQQSALNVLALLAIAALIFFIPGAYAGGLPHIEYGYLKYKVLAIKEINY